jgi:hypothetical protein
MVHGRFVRKGTVFCTRFFKVLREDFSFMETIIN